MAVEEHGIPALPCKTMPLVAPHATRSVHIPYTYALPLYRAHQLTSHWTMCSMKHSAELPSCWNAVLPQMAGGTANEFHCFPAQDCGGQQAVLGGIWSSQVSWGMMPLHLSKPLHEPPSAPRTTTPLCWQCVVRQGFGQPICPLWPLLCSQHSIGAFFWE